MNRLLHLLMIDIKQVFRDKMLVVFLFTPFILILVARFGLPLLTIEFPIISEYYIYIVMFASVQSSILFGFLSSFILLDEKDENVLQVLRILPIKPLTFLLYRLGFFTLFSSLGAFFMIQCNGIITLELLPSVFLSLQFGLIAPFISLVVGTYAKNKIEGMAFFKGIDLILILPVLYFFIPNIFRYVFAIIPTYWSFRLFEKNAVSVNDYSILISGFGYYFLVLLTLFFQFKKRVLERD